MEIDSVQISLEHKESAAFLMMIGKPFGLKARMTLEQLEALAQELTREASSWRRRILPDYYAILEVSHTATTAEIKAAYRRLMKAHHPDTGGNTEHTQVLNQAWSVLSDPQGRHAYDQSINQHERSTAA